jgi:hypothetical protein
LSFDASRALSPIGFFFFAMASPETSSDDWTLI